MVKNIVRRINKKLGWVTAVIVVVLGIFLIYQSGHRTSPHAHQPLLVAVAPVTTQAVPIALKMPGTIEAAQSVDVRAQVSGTLKKINFKPGQFVKAGQLLFEIDSEPFEADLAQAKATLMKDKAQLVNDQENLAREAALVKNGYVSQQEYDQSVAQLKMQSAAVAADEDVVKQKQIQLNYTKITAPISGKTGEITLKIGSLVSSTANTSLVTINQLDTVLVDFNLAQHDLPELFNYRKKNVINIEVWTETGNKLLAKGKLVFVNNTVNAQTGSILLKGSIDNANHLLWPAQMVTVKLILATESSAIVVPSQAIRMDDIGAFVYVVKNKQAVLRRVVVDRQINQLTVIKSGLKSGESVITVAPPNLEDGSFVIVSSPKTKVAP